MKTQRLLPPNHLATIPPPPWRAILAVIVIASVAFALIRSS